MHYKSHLDIERVRLERFKFGLQHQLHDMNFMADVEVEQYMDYLSRNMVMQLRTEIMGQRLNNFKYPADWKQAFKERWFPKWLLKKFPVKYATLEVKALYPQLQLPKHEYEPVFHVMKGNPFIREGEE